MASDAETGRNPEGAVLMTDITDSITNGVIVAVGSHRNAVLCRAFPYGVLYHPDGGFGISSSDVKAFFHQRALARQVDQKEMIREIRSADGRAILSERALTLEEAQGLLSVIICPGQREAVKNEDGEIIGEALIIDRLVKLSEAEQTEILGNRAGMAAEARDLIRVIQASVAASDAQNALKGIRSVRPFAQRQNID